MNRAPGASRGAALSAVALAALVALPCELAHAQEATSNPATAPVAAPGAAEPSISSSVPPLGDFKKALLDRGVNFQLDYIEDTFGNPTGGVKQGFTYSSALYMLVDADLAKLAGLTGASFRANAFQIQGRGLSTYNVYNYSTISSVDAKPTTRLYELWVQQELFPGVASVRIGQLAADNQFFLSEFGNDLYINGTFGWPNIFAADFPSGGPGYPLTTPGVSLKLTPHKQITLLAAIFNGDPAGAGFTGLQEVKDPAGINFRLKDPPLLFGEAQLAYNQEKAATGLAGTIKLGAWYHFGPFNDNHFGFDGRSLADPLSIGQPVTHSGDYGVYGVIDQMLWRLPGDDPKKGVGAFARITGSPSDRNLMDLYAEAGVNFMGVWRERPDDTFGCAAAFSHLSPRRSARSIEMQSSFLARSLRSATMSSRSNSPTRRRSFRAGSFNPIFNTSSTPEGVPPIPSIRPSGGSLTPRFLGCARQLLFEAAPARRLDRSRRTSRGRSKRPARISGRERG